MDYKRKYNTNYGIFSERIHASNANDAITKTFFVMDAEETLTIVQGHCLKNSFVYDWEYSPMLIQKSIITLNKTNDCLNICTTKNYTQFKISKRN